MITQFSETIYFSGATSFPNGLTFSPISGNFNSFEQEKRVWVYPPSAIFDSQKNLIGFFDSSPSGFTASAYEYTRGSYSTAIFIPNEVTGHMNCGGIFLKGNFSSLVNGSFLMNESWAQGSTTFQPIQITGVQTTSLDLDERNVNKEYVPYSTQNTSSSSINVSYPITYLNSATETDVNTPDKIYRLKINNKNFQWSSSNIFVKMFFSTDFRDTDKITSFDVIVTPTDIGDVTFSESFTMNASLDLNSKGITGFLTVNDYNTIPSTSSRSDYFSFGLKVNGAEGCSLNGLMLKNDGKTEIVASQDRFNNIFAGAPQEIIEEGYQIQIDNINSTLFENPNYSDSFLGNN